MSRGVWCADCQTVHLYAKEWYEEREKSYDDPLWSPDDDEGENKDGWEGGQKVG